ncbi:CopD family protein [Haloechinothrix halophila]|uniref:CopD family protein n=1 Tax=Haloechinothrix halophila TaxID=1069073 RepID=UPI0006875714|nr:CopD family protein [Haloechinothrix halophila]
MLVTDIGSASALWDSGPGLVVLTHAAGFGLALVLFALRRRMWALLPLVAVPVAEGVGSHSNVELPIAGAALTGVHLAAAALWVGTLLHVGCAALLWRSWRGAVRWVLVSYARMAAWVFVLVVATGLTMALLLVPLPALTTTAYGQSLLVKLGLVAMAAGLALAGRWALRRQRLGRVTKTVRVGGKTFLSNEPYNSGVAPIAARVESESGATRLLMGFPAAGTHAEVTLDKRGRITEETLTGPKHVFTRRFLYPDG